MMSSERVGHGGVRRELLRLLRERRQRTHGSRSSARSLKGTVMAGPTYEEKKQIFERHFLLGKLSAAEIDTLLTYSRVERYPAGREMFSKGSPGTGMMAVLRGSLKMSSLSDAGKEVVFRIVNPGEIFGEI